MQKFYITRKIWTNYKYKIIEPNNLKIITDGDRVYLGFTKQIGYELKCYLNIILIITKLEKYL